MAASPVSEQTADSIFRVTADLVQADVIVVDQQGRFVDNLQRDQIELRVDDTPEDIAIFERVQTGPTRIGPQQEGARRETPALASSAEASGSSLDRGRTVLFFVDDFHLAHASLERARRVLADFIEREMGPKDQVAIATTSGQTGFLQQLTANKAVLRTALTNLRNRMPAALDVELPPMTAHQAHVLERGSDRELLAYFIRETQRVFPFLLRDAAESIVLGRAHRIVEQSGAITLDTLNALEAFIRSVGELPGRKIVFFVSDGFLINIYGPDTSSRMQRIADAAARSRVAIYAMDAKGLATLPSFDANRPASFDPANVVTRTDADELNSSQEPLFRLAAETGGRALINSNALSAAIPRALQETSVYYLLAWTPDPGKSQDNRFHRIAVSVKGKPEWIVRAPRGFFGAPPADDARGAATSHGHRKAAAPAAEGNDPIETALLSALHSTHAVTTLPMSLSLGFIDMPSTGAVLTASTNLIASTLGFGAGDRGQAVVDVMTVVFNDRGQGVSTVKERLTIQPPSGPLADDTMHGPVAYRHQFQLKPGLYQVRVAARDGNTERVGSTMEWIEIPDLSSGPLSMSSLILGEPPSNKRRGADAEVSTLPMEVNERHRFKHDPRLRILTYIYNAVRSTAPPDVVLRIQVFQGDKVVVATPLSTLKTEGVTDLSRIPYFAELNMEGSPGGVYTLQVTAVDRAADTNTSQRSTFEIE